MRKTQRVNDACACGSGKIFKECCIYRKPTKLHLHSAVEPASMTQRIMRAQIELLTQHIAAPHCRVCGDTAAQSNLVTVPTPLHDIILCEFYAPQTKILDRRKIFGNNIL